MFKIYSLATGLSGKKLTKALFTLAGAGLVAVVSTTPRAAEAASLNWNFLFSNSLQADITIQTSGPITTGVTNSITGISGTIGGTGRPCISSNDCYIITGLNTSYGSPTNTFQYNPTVYPSDPNAFFTDLYGISFDTSETAQWNISFQAGGSTYGKADYYLTDGSITIPEYGPIQGPGPAAPVPAPSPLPIFGAIAAFGTSRRLRSRVLSSQLR